MPPKRKLDRFISIDTLRHLQDRRLATEASGGWITVKRTAYSYFTGYFPEENRSIEVPEFIQSVQTLESLELNHETARNVYHDYMAYIRDPHHDHVSILKYAKYHVETVQGDCRHRSDLWGDVMNDIGLNKGWQERMWDSNWDGRRWRTRKSSLKDEVLEMMDTRYNYLLSLNGKIRDKYEDEVRERAD